MNKGTYTKKFRNTNDNYSERIKPDLEQTGVMWPRAVEAEVAVGRQSHIGGPFLGGTGIYAGI